MNRRAGTGVAAREFQLASGSCDYLLLVGGKACGVVEAKAIIEKLGFIHDLIHGRVGGERPRQPTVEPYAPVPESGPPSAPPAVEI